MRKQLIRLTKLSVLILTLFSAIPATCQVSVLTQHNDNARTGQNLNEATLNTSNVNQNSFGKLFWRTVDGFIYAQPLYVPALTIQGATHNVVYVATQHNSVYAFDADNPNEPAPLWQVNLGTPVPSQDICIISGDTNPADCPYYDISPEIGITSTPVIDPTAGIIYVVNRTKNTSNSTYHDYLHALDLTTGAERLSGPVEIVGQVSGTGTASVGGTLAFDPTYHHQRPSLLLVNGFLYICFGSVGDIGGTYHGWVMTYNASTLQQQAIISITPNGNEGGVWSAGQGPVADAAGNVYIMTGNGDFTANTGGNDYGDSFMKFTGSSLAVGDYFTPQNQGALDAGNTDLGSGGPMLLPGTSLLVGMGKDGVFRVVNTSNMGKYNSSVDNDVQEFTALANAFFSSPVYWNSPNNGPVVYIWGPTDFLKAFQFTGSKFATTPVSQGTIQNSSGDPNAAALSISANSSQQGSGILWSSASLSQWAKGTQVPGVVRAFDATNLTNELWDSTQNLARDDVGSNAKFDPPTVVNGKVYVGSFSGQLQVYGLNPPAFQGIQFVQVGSASPQSTTASVPVAYPGSQTAGNLNAVIVGWHDSTASIQSVTDSAGNSYALAIGPTSGTGLRQSIYYAKNILGSGANTVTVTFNQGATKPDVRILEYSGADVSNPLDVSAGASGNSNVADSGFVTTNAANELVVGANTIAASNTTIMAGAPFTPRVITTTDSEVAEDRLVNVPGSYHSWAPLNASGAWVEQVVTFRAAAAGTVPFVSSVSPSGGPVAGGTAVTITGTNFAAGATVTFGAAAATSVVVVSSTTITATTPAGSAGAVTVTVTVNGQSGSLTNGFTYVVPPTVSSVSPSSGSTAGGTAVTITGTNFVAGATVTFGSAAATNVVVVSSTSITATTPAGSAGAVTVTVTVSGQSGSLASGFTYAVVPTVSSVSPNNGPAAGGTAVTITGTNFAAGATVKFGATAATNVVVVSSTSITATTPTGSAGAVTVTVTVNGQTGSLTNGFTYVVPATVSSVSPSSGSTAGGTAVTITGTNFVAGATVTFGSAAATNVVVVSSTSITATTPAGSAGAVTVTVTNPGVQSGSLANGYTYAVTPTVSSVSPNNGPAAGGTAVTITGTNFAAGATVKFGATAATNVVVVSSTSITATTPAGAGAVTVTVTVNGQSGSLTNGFTYTGTVAISFGQVASATPQSPTATVAVTYPAAETAGDLNVVVVGWNDTVATVQSVKDSVGNPYSLAIGPTTGTGMQQSIYYAASIVGGNNTVTVTFSQAAAFPDVRILEYRGVTTLDVTAGASGSSAAANSGAATTTSANELIFGANIVSTTTGAAGSGFTSRIITSPDGDIAEDKLVTTAGSNSATATLTGAGPWVMQMATFSAVSGPVPTVGSVSPNSGSTAGGTAVTITGTNFVAGATVTLGATAATNVVVVNSTTITATTPAGSAGAATVTVTENGQSGSLASAFTYIAPPTVSSVAPSGGSPTGGTAVTITGANFAAGATVKFGATAATNVVVVSSTSITATTPAGSAGAVTVTVTNSNGLSGSLTSGFTYAAPPTVSSVSPSSGSTAGGTAVTITGTNFAAGATVEILETRRQATNVVVVNSTTITATTPSGDAGAVTVTVTVNGQSGNLANGFTYIAPPSVSSVAPSSGSPAGGTAVTITGTNFAAGATVTFGATAATNVVVVSSTSITATTPAGSVGAVTVAVTVNGLTGSLTNGFTYVVPPTVSSVSPSSGSTAGGTAVTITGTNFVAGATVTFGSAAATNVVVVSSTSITATTPAGSAGAVTVTVTNVGSQSGSLANGYTYAVTPTVSSVSPNNGPAAGGTAVTITGTNFAAGATVKFGATAATNVVVVSSTSITATTPTGSAGAVTVTVTVNGQTGSLTNGFTYVVPATVSSVSPSSGSTAGGTAVTITGTNFVAGATVTFGSAAATNVVVVSSTSITATTPAGSAGAVTVTVTVSGQSGSLASGFAYVVAPTVSSVSPNNGPAAGGTAVTITGTNFAAGATVKFGATAATNVVVVSSTSITATTPAGAGAVTVTVTVNGQSGSLTNGFTYTGTVAISFGQVASATPQSPTATVAVTYPAAETAGDLNVVVVGWNDTVATVQSVKDSVGNPYSLAIGPTTGTGMQQSIYYAASIVGGNNTVTVTFSQAAAFPDVRILEYRGVTTLDVTAGASGSSAAANSGAATTTSANELIFGANIVSTTTGAAGSGFTSRIITSPDGDIAEDKLVTTAGSNSATATLTGAGPWVMQMATFSAVSGPVPTVGSVSPNSGSTAGGTAVTITGTNFVAGATVTLGATAATNVVVVNSTTITATTPAGSAGAATVTVTENGQSGSLASAFTYIAPPTVSSVAPSGGSPTGGTAVTITGANFAAGATVKFGATAATNVVVVSSTSITATTPAGSAGAVTVTVTNSNGLSGSLTSGFTYAAPPTVSSVSPSSGSTAGGTAVTITGTNFVAGATVTFGSAAATNVAVVNSTTITATTPAGSVGAVTVTVTVSGQSGSLASGFTYVVAPTVSSVSPSNGPAAGGTAVTITGTNFAAGATVKFGATAATNVVVVSSTSITATTPAGSAGAVPVAVTVNGQSGSLTNGFTYVVPPTVSSVSPSSGSTAGGTAVTITGTNFVAGATVTFGSAAATNVVVVSSTSITATTPAGSAGAVTVSVTVSGQSGSLASGFTYVVAPTVSSVSPNNGPAAGGTAVTITGTNFAAGATVKFGATAATNVVVVSSTSITATTPAGSAGAVPVAVTVNGQTGSLTNGFTYVVPPTVSSVSPSSGSTAGGTAVTITGTNFVAGATVKFGATAATNVVVVSSTSITATTPAGSAGAVTVTVTVSGQSGSLASGFTYVVAPTVSSISPNNGPAAGGTAVTITGTNFAAGATVKFGATAATNVVVVSSTSITATTPAGAGAVTVTVTVNGQSGSLTNGFTYTGTVAISFGQVASATPQSPTATVAVTYPAAETAGDLNVVVVGWNDTAATVQSVKDSAGNPYSLAIGPTTGTGLQQSIYYAASIVGGSNTVTVTFSQAAAFPDIRILEYRGVTTLDVTAGASGSSAAANSGAATTTSANELIFGADMVSTTTGAAGSGFTSRIITSPDGDIAEDKLVTTAGSNSATATLTGAGPWVMQMATFSAVSGPVPTVGSVSPNSGSTAGGTAVTITGTNFVAGATVTLGATAATNVVVVNSTTITATTPAGSAGAATVTVTENGQSGSLASAFTYIAPPTVSSVAPSGGSPTGGTAVTITGANFAAGATVKFGATAATNVVVVSSTSITATTPAGSAGAVTVTVTNSNGLSGSLTSGFTYAAPPTVSGVGPNSGSTAGGTVVTITGTNFVAGATVTFGSAAATNVAVVNSTTITATTPAGSAGAVTVTVTVSGQSGSLASAFTYVVTAGITAPGNFAGALMGTSAPTYVAGQESYNATAGTSFTTAPFNSTGADLLVMFLGCHNNTVFTITDNYGNSWLPLAGPAYKVGTAFFPMEGEFFYVPNATTGTSHTITVGLSQTEPLVMSIAALSGDNIYSPIDNYSSITGDNGTVAKYIASSPLTTSQPNDLLLGIVKGFGNNTYTAGTGYTTQSASTGLNFGAETQIASSAGNYTSSFTASVGDFWQTVMAAIAPKPNETVLLWTASTGGIIANYYIERCTGLVCSSFSQIASIPSSTLTYTDTTISSGTVYNYRVRAQDSSGTFSPYSNVLALSPIMPYVVSGFTATPARNLSWNASAESGGSISQYSIERCTGLGCSSFSQIATTSNTSYTDTSAAAGTTYNYRVRARDANNFYGPYSVTAVASIPAYFDNAADGGNNGGSTTSLTYSYAVGTNSNRLLLVNLVGDPSADDISSVTYAGASMTLLKKVQTPGDRWHYLYYLLAPASGTNNVVISAGSSHYLISEATSWNNVAQTGQPLANATNTAAGGIVSMTTSLPASSNNVIVAESMWAPIGIVPGNGSSALIADSAFQSLGMFTSVASPVTQAFPVSITNTWSGQASASSVIASFTLASTGTPGITFDNSADGGNNSGSTTSLTYSYTVGTGPNRLLVVNLIGDTSADDITSVTYAGTPMTFAGKVQAPSSNNWQYFYYILNPTSGTHNIVATAASQHYLISQVASWFNVRQTAQLDAFTTNTLPAANTSATTSLTTIAAGSLVVQGLWSFGHLAAGTGAIPIVIDTAIGGAGIFVSSGSPVSPAGNVSMTTISDGTMSTGVIMLSFAPAP